MESSGQRFESFVQSAKARHQQQFRLSILIAAVIAALLWRTQWLSLRPGLVILLLGQTGMACVYLYRWRQRVDGERPRVSMLSWFASEARFVSWSALSESCVRLVGFVVLGYGFWTATRNLTVTLLLGAVYPFMSYYGVSRRNTSKTLASLAHQREEIL